MTCKAKRPHPLRPGLLDTLHGYRRQHLAADTIAGAITAILIIPQGMAYALLAGLPAQYGLYAAIFPPALYALWGTSRTLAVGPVAVASLMVANALANYAETTPEWIEGAVILAAEVSAMLLIAGALGFGRLVAFISHPVLRGFTSAAAILIVVSQIGPLLGIEVNRGAAPEMLQSLMDQAGRIDGPTAAVATLAIVTLLLGRSPAKRLLLALGLSQRSAAMLTRTVPLVVVVVATAAIALLTTASDRPVAVVGEIPSGLPVPGRDLLNASGWIGLLPSAAAIALIGYVESITVAQVLAARRRERVDPTRELIALGLANAGSAIAGTMPAAGGFSRSVVNDEAGAHSQVAAVITAVLVAIITVWFTGWFETLPRAVLAAIIVIAVIQLIEPREALAILQFDRGDGATLAATFAAVLVFGIEIGLATGIALSLLIYVWRTSRPHIAIVGRVPGTEHYRNVLRHRVECHPKAVMLRVDENIYFANADAIREVVLDAIDQATGPRYLVVAMTSV
ncbi:MAG: SulP family inorganic anion transporter, partial [Ectothiorhodospiraceae bacterium]